MRSAPAPGNIPNRNEPTADSFSPNTTLTPMSCFMTTEGAIHVADDTSIQSQSRYSKAICEATSRNAKYQQQPSVSESASILWPSPSSSSSSASLSSFDRGLETPNELSRPPTPVLVQNPGPGSISSSSLSPMSSCGPSTSTSRIGSALSLAYVSQQSSAGHILRIPSNTADDHTPQLIMPSVTVLQRRPFSDTGKQLGKLKILVAGRAGIGKSSLIRSIVQCCEHIVHVDPAISLRGDTVSELHASTRPYPRWRTQPEVSIPTRRPLTVDEVLERNICFVDCLSKENSNTTNPAVQYTEAQLLPLLHRPIGDNDLWKLLSSGSEPIVDAVLYLLPHTGPELPDIETIRSLQAVTNVIPLLARVDELCNDSIATSKQHIHDHLNINNIECFSFVSSCLHQHLTDIFSVSNRLDFDNDTMDASILMNSEYIQPSISTELKNLVEQMICPDGIDRLRYCASFKCVRWRQQRLRGASQTIISCRQPIGSYNVVASMNWNRMPLQPRWQPIEMASWAQNLRQSLAAERLFESPLQGFSTDATVYAIPLTNLAQSLPHTRHRKPRSQKTIHQHQDPLGLLVLAGQIKCNSRLTLELVSGVSVLGYFTSWLARSDS